MSATRVRMTSRSSFSVVSSLPSPSLDVTRARRLSISCDSRWFSSAARTVSSFMRSTMLTRSFTFSSSRSMGSRSTLRVIALAMVSLSSVSLLSLNRGVLAHERRQNGLDALLHFGIGQRAIRLERQPDRQAHGALRDALALIPIEEAHRAERRRQIAAGRPNGAMNDFRRQGVRDDDREVADDERMARQRARGVGGLGARPLDQIEIGFRDEHAILTRQSPRVGERRRDLSGHADARAA